MKQQLQQTLGTAVKSGMRIMGSAVPMTPTYPFTVHKSNGAAVRSMLPTSHLTETYDALQADVQ